MYFIKKSGRRWHFHNRGDLVSYTEVSNFGADSNLVVVLRQEIDGFYVRLTDSEARTSPWLSNVANGNVMFKGKWKRAGTRNNRDNQNNGNYFD